MPVSTLEVGLAGETKNVVTGASGGGLGTGWCCNLSLLDCEVVSEFGRMMVGRILSWETGCFIPVPMSAHRPS